MRASRTRRSLEPEGCNSAPAIAVAALLVAEADPETVLWIMAADAAINDVPALHTALNPGRGGGAHRADRDLWDAPGPAAYGFRYIEMGDTMKEVAGVHVVARFTEKPDLETWPSASRPMDGMSGTAACSSPPWARTLLQELTEHAPAVLARRRAPRLRPRRGTWISSACRASSSARPRPFRSTTR